MSDSFVFAGYIFVTREFGVENIDKGLQMSYNLCNLPKQITAANGTSVKYSYFADGTKFKAVDATGNGFVYTGSLRWGVQDGILTPESIAITGGRAVYSDNNWAANYYIADHLGSVRAVTDAEGEVLDTFDYMPYGSELIVDTDNITDYRFTGKEKQTAFGNSNIYDSFARFQNTYGRFMSIDPKAESFYHISPYTYCAGDPVNLVDPDGFQPWEIRNAWNDYYIKLYQSHLSGMIKNYSKGNRHFTCEDLALSVLIDFAMFHGLPISIKNGSGIYDSRSDKYSSYIKFKKDILKTTGARDLQNNHNTQSISENNAQVGDIILNRNRDNTPTHVQLVYYINEDIWGIAQGNSNFLNKVPGASRLFNASDPSSSFYIGTNIQFAEYHTSKDEYKRKNEEPIKRFSKKKNISIRRWNFENF